MIYVLEKGHSYILAYSNKIVRKVCATANKKDYVYMPRMWQDLRKNRILY